MEDDYIQSLLEMKTQRFLYYELKLKSFSNAFAKSIIQQLEK